MGIGTKGVHVSELKYKTCPARWIYFCVGVFAGFLYLCRCQIRFLPEHVNVLAAAHERLLAPGVTLAYNRFVAEDLIS